LLNGYLAAGRLDKALPLLDETLRRSKARLGPDHPDTVTCLGNLAKAFNTRSMLGGALLGQKKYADAEPLLLQGYEGMKQRAARIPPPGRIRLPEAVRRLVALYEATGNQDAVTEGMRDEKKAGTSSGSSLSHCGRRSVFQDFFSS
jgi:hypothetical protein